MTRLTRRSVMIGAGAGLLAMPAIARGQAALTRVRFTSGWALQGGHAYMVYAQKQGYAKAGGADLQVSRGFGSGRVPVDVAGGVFDLGSGEMSATLKFMAENPNNDLVIVAIMHDTNQMSMTVRADSDIKTPKDIEGKTLAAPDFDVGRQLFPAFAKMAGIDTSKVSWLSVAPELREPMLVQKRADGVTGQTSSTALSLKRLGMDLPQQRTFFYRDSGLDLYSGCYVTTRKFAQANPGPLKAAVSALLRSYVETYRDPQPALAALKEVEPLTDLKVEAERLAFEKSVLPMKRMKTEGVSAVDQDRLRLCITTIEEAYGVPKHLTNDRVFTDAYLPPASERMV